MRSARGFRAVLTGIVLFVVSALPAGALAPDDTGADGEQGLATADQLMFSTFLGGNDYDSPMFLTSDSSGNAYITGLTCSSDFPTTSGAYDTTHNGGEDIFVSKVSSDGSKLLWSTLIGGSGDDGGCSVSLDSNGDVVLIGYTYSSDFPTTSGCYDGTANGGRDLALVKLDATGSTLKYSSYFGGSDYENGHGFIGPGGKVIVSGETASSNFPTTSGAYDTSQNGNYDIFVSEFKADLKTMVFSTYIGGSRDDESWDVSVADSAGNVYVGGLSSSTDFPVSSGCYQDTNSGNQDSLAFVLAADGATLMAATFIGGSSQDNLRGIAVNSHGDVVLAGYSGSNNFPTTTGAFDTSSNGGWDVTVSVLDSDLSTLKASTYIGGSGEDSCNRVLLDGSGLIYLTGYTDSSDLPIQGDSYDGTHNGNRDAFLMLLDANCTELLNSTYIGGSDGDAGTNFDLDADNSIHLTGNTGTDEFPITSGCYDGSYNGGLDAYVLKFSFHNEPGPVNLTDRDGDGVRNEDDAFPDNPYEYIDTDGDGMGDNLDPDADGDGYLDERDAFPLNATEWDDTDLDRVGDNADLDDDSDGVPDAEDAFPKNPAELMDADGDGIGDDLDPDDDNDGVRDDVEARDELMRRLDDVMGAIGLMGDRMERDMADINRSLQGSVSGLGGDILLELERVNSSLATDIEGLLERITADISGLNASTSARLTSMLGALQSDTDSLEGWLDIVMGQLRSNLTEVQGDIRAFQGSTEQNLTGISTALEDLQKLEAIIQDIDELDQALGQAQDELGGDITETHEEQMGRTGLVMALVIIVVVLVVVLLLMLVRMRAGDGKDAPPQGMA